MVSSPPGKYTKLESVDSDSEFDSGNGHKAHMDRGVNEMASSSETSLVRDFEDAADGSESGSPLFVQNAAEGSSANLRDSASSSENRDANAPSQSSDLEEQRSPNQVRLSPSQRLLNVIHYVFPFKQTYQRLNNGITTGRLQANVPGRFVGQGTDGVFRNLMAKPDTQAEINTQEQHPPTYDEAAADNTPEYWETTMISPMYDNEVFVQGLPVGNLANFVWNALVTVAFQLVGFILCYLLHTSHAAKQGTRAGLGIMILMYGYDRIPSNFGRADKIPVRYEPEDPNMIDVTKSSSIKAGSKIDEYHSSLFNKQDFAVLENTKTPYFAYGLIAFGIFIMLKASVDYFKVKQKEKRILAPQASAEVNTTTEEVNTQE
ncbi:hypothetical protein FT663_00236 [Candidozyma haemuli var. vulneris]|uniref:Metal homeostatis protein BSD2 n=1 Tax=Candidozyma haemuli TaxID=45357 RepID=A0A2V1APM5_9ASCO|nr:hypothetical protein CXQ85_003580 [[Candida] haemuloni]KAF3993566.1 hypothetical protein FT662_00486 [[Candida] haemuloni var. vulneris]KAF3995640.1 hypothetical protein FT663_00236 [[Candida] haemuloni var. vulneris]PVH19725.1 hypothetical protein CXQ85_003580 [[Candida] haemuloni]